MMCSFYWIQAFVLWPVFKLVATFTNWEMMALIFKKRAAQCRGEVTAEDCIGAFKLEDDILRDVWLWVAIAALAVLK